MVNSKAEALGIIFPNSYDSLVPELVTERLMASIPFAGRYRMCDFLISSMVHCGIDNISSQFFLTNLPIPLPSLPITNNTLSA